MSATTSTAIKKAGQPSPVWLVLIAVAVIVALGYNSYSSWRVARQAEAARKQAAAKAVAPPTPSPATTPAPPVVQQIGQGKRLYRFSEQPSGCVERSLPANWSEYPKGGAVRVTDLETGKVLLIDKPGVENKTQFPPGKFGFCAEDADAWGVDIWE